MHAVFADAGLQHRPVQGMWLRRVHHVRGGDVAVKKLYSYSCMNVGGHIREEDEGAADGQVYILV